MTFCFYRHNLCSGVCSEYNLCLFCMNMRDDYKKYGDDYLFYLKENN